MKIKTIKIDLCELCLAGIGEECHTPDCAMFLRNSPGLPLHEEMYKVLGERESIITEKPTLNNPCQTCGEKEGRSRVDNGTGAGVHCDECWAAMIQECRSRSW